MKRTGLILFSAGLILLGAGCVSSGKAVLSQRDPIALVSFVSNRDINWKGEKPANPNNLDLLTRRALNSNPDLVAVSGTEELINTAEIFFREAMAASNLINLAEKETVLYSRSYREARLNKLQIYNEMQTPGNYRIVDYRDKNFLSAFAEETGIQRSMFVEFDFTKAMAGGIGKQGNCRVNLAMKVTILDAQGKTLYQKTHSANDGSSINVKFGAYSQAELMELCEFAIKDVCDKFLSSIPGA